MTHDEYIHYADQYVDGAQKISIRSTKPVIEKETYSLNLEHSFGNYDLYFNTEGVLLYSVHFENNKFRTVYGYDNKGQLVTSMQVKLDTGELMELSTFDYDGDGRLILERCHENDFDLNFEDSEDRIHKYYDNTEEIVTLCQIEPDAKHVEIVTYDEASGLVTDRTIKSDDKLVIRVAHEYSDESVIRRIYSCKSVEPYEVSEYIRGEHRLITTCKHRSDESSCIFKYVFTFDEKGEWTSRVSLEDGEPKHNVERKIDYCCLLGNLIQLYVWPDFVYLWEVDH